MAGIPSPGTQPSHVRTMPSCALLSRMRRTVVALHPVAPFRVGVLRWLRAFAIFAGPIPLTAHSMSSAIDGCLIDDDHEWPAFTGRE